MYIYIGIWYEWADEVKEICAGGDLTVSRVHTHIGSGSDPAVWQKVGGTLARREVRVREAVW